jgi:putative FmdB family regulatory protein
MCADRGEKQILRRGQNDKIVRGELSVPLYEYRCRACGHQFEKIQSFSAPEEKVCPVCGGEVEKLLSAPAVQFKGSGWYATDYAGKGGNKPAASNSDTGNGNASKPAEKPAASTSSSESSASASKPASSTSKSE